MGLLDGKVCVITGSGGGIGRETAVLFAREGGRVVVSDVDEAGGRETVRLAVEAGGEAAGGVADFVACDVTDDASVRHLFDAAVERFGRLDVSVHNAGIMAAGDEGPVETGLDVWSRVLAVNLTGVFLSCKHAIPKLRASGGGSIVNMASMVALVGAAMPQIAYTASNGGVLAMTREIAVVYARRGIRANALCPGPIRTPLAAPFLANEEKRRNRLEHIPLERFGEADEVAKAALFLASDLSSYVTGAALVVDGGLTSAYLTHGP